MPTRKFTIPTTATSIYALFDSDDQALFTCQGMGLQADDGNSGSVFFGSRASKAQELVAGAATFITINSPRDVWVRSENGTELLNVSLTLK